MTAKATTRAIRLVGTDAPDTVGLQLQAGPLSLELDNGAIRYVRYQGVEVLRAIAFLVRDENWGTYVPEIDGLEVWREEGGFRVSYRARCGGNGRALRYRAGIAGKADGTLLFQSDAVAETDFPTNRTGFIVLHPLHRVAGCPVEVLHVDGTVTRDKFPETINPLQPFLQIRALTHEVVPGVRATVRMEGDTFEMEDHRNWTDASFKTYVRPLALPWPYTIANGTKFDQSVTVTFHGRPKSASTVAGGPIRIDVGGPGGTMPRIGLGVPIEEAEPALAALDLLKAIAPQILTCQVDPRRGATVDSLRRYRRLAESLGAEPVLEIVVPCVKTPGEELAAVAAEVAQSGLEPAAVTVSAAADIKAVLPGSKAPEVPPFDVIFAAARKAFPGLPLGGGTYAFFTELNRKRPPAALIDYFGFTTSPIVHAADDRSVMETIEALPFVAGSGRRIFAGKPYRVGPSAIGARDNPYGAATAPNPDNRRVCLARNDPRWRGVFGAAWTAAYIASFARGGAEAVTIGAPVGPFGMVYRTMPEPQPYYDQLGKAAVYPVYHVVRGFARVAGAPMLSATSSAPTKVACAACRGRTGTTLWLANLTAEPQTVAVSGTAVGSTRVRMLDETTFTMATADPVAFAATGAVIAESTALTLAAYAVACLEQGA